MAKPVTDEEREQIVALIRAGENRNEIARQTGRSKSTVSKIAAEIGHSFLDHADGTTKTRLARAHDSRSAYSAERRAEIAAACTEKVERILAEMEQPFVAFNFGGKDNTYNEHEMDRPPVDAVRTMVQSVRDLVRTVLDIDRHDNRAEDGLAAVDQWLRGLVGDEAAA